MKFSRENISQSYKSLRNSGWFHSLLLFLGFVALSSIFWLTMALNDNVEESVVLRINISNTPDSVTFITVPPAEVHVTVQDRGTSLMRSTLFQHPDVSFNFRDFASDGVLRVTRGDFQAALKGVFSPDAVIAAASIDSLSLVYTTGRGKRVPVVVHLDATAVSGRTIAGRPHVSPDHVTVYGSRNLIDTVVKVSTERIVRRNLEEPLTLSVKLNNIAGARIIPDRVKVTIPVESLVKKVSQVKIQAENVPDGVDLLFFPQKVKVVYYVPMSRFSDDNPGFVVRADYNDIERGNHDRLPLYVDHVPSYIHNVELTDKSVDYTVVKD